MGQVSHAQLQAAGAGASVDGFQQCGASFVGVAGLVAAGVIQAEDGLMWFISPRQKGR